MKYLLLPIILIACSPKKEHVILYDDCMPPDNVAIFCLDSCEYIRLENSCIIHKANCRNPIHLNQLIIKQLNNEPRTKKR